MPNQSVINELQRHRDDLIINPVSTGTFTQACKNFYQYFETMTGEQIRSLEDADWWFNEWNGNSWLN